MPAIIIAVVTIGVILALLNGLLGGGKGGNGGPWQNEGYQLPEYQANKPALPSVTSLNTAEELTKNNKLYQQTLASPVRCELDRIDATKASKSELKAQLEKQQDCLLRVWGPALEAAGYQPVRSKITVYSGTAQSACGKLPRHNAVYCSLDQNIYVATDLTEITGSLSTEAFVMEAVMAHEFAHSVQGRAGIIGGRNLLARAAENEDDQRLLVRRNEAQADCMATMFFNSTQQALSLTDQDKSNIVNTFRAVGSDRGGNNKPSTHPTMKSRETWAKKGVATLEVKACNAYTVPASEMK